MISMASVGFKQEAKRGSLLSGQRRNLVLRVIEYIMTDMWYNDMGSDEKSTILVVKICAHPRNVLVVQNPLGKGQTPKATSLRKSRRQTYAFGHRATRLEARRGAVTIKSKSRRIF